MFLAREYCTLFSFTATEIFYYVTSECNAIICLDTKNFEAFFLNMSISIKNENSGQCTLLILPKRFATAHNRLAYGT